jgi:hypothetical protein
MVGALARWTLHVVPQWWCGCDHRIGIWYGTAHYPLGWPALAVRMSIHRTFCCSCERAPIPSRAQVPMRCKMVRAFARRDGLTGGSTSPPDMLLMGKALARHTPACASALFACDHLSWAPVAAQPHTEHAMMRVACLAVLPLTVYRVSPRMTGRRARIL